MLPDWNGFGCTFVADPVEANTISARTRTAARASADFFIVVLLSDFDERDSARVEDGPEEPLKAR